MATSSINFRFGRIIVLLKRLTNSKAETAEVLFMEAQDLLPKSLCDSLFELIQHPAKYEDDTEFLDEIILELKSEL